MRIEKRFLWLRSSSRVSQKRDPIPDVSVNSVLEDIQWAKDNDIRDVLRSLWMSRALRAGRPEVFARQILDETTIRLDGEKTGSILIGKNPSGKRYIFSFNFGKLTPLRKIIHPRNLENLNDLSLPLPRKVKLLLVNVKSPEYPVVTAPLAIITLGGYLKEVFSEQITVDYCDLQIDQSKTLRQKVAKFEPDIIGLSVKVGGTGQISGLLRLLARTTLAGDPLVVLGNVVPTYADEELHNRYPNIICCLGRGELMLKSLVMHTSKDRPVDGLFSVPGCSFVIDDVIHETAGESFDLASLGPADWQALFSQYPSENYQEVWIEASRGCPQKRGGVGCSFCSIMPNAGSRDWRSRPVDNLLSEIKTLSQAGIKHIRFADEEFMAGQAATALQFARQLLRHKTELQRVGLSMPTFDFAVRVDDITKRGVQNSRLEEHLIDGERVWRSKNELRLAALQTYRKAGLLQVYLGLESGSTQQLKRMYKAVSPVDNASAITVLRRLNIQIAGGWIMIDPMMPGLDDLKENISFIISNNLIPQTPADSFITNPISRMRVLEGSPLVEQMRQRGLLRRKKENLIEYDYSYEHKHVQIIAEFLQAWEKDMFAQTYLLKNVVATAALTPSRSYVSEILSNCSLRLKSLDFELIQALVGEVDNATASASLNERLKRIQIVFREKRAEIVTRTFQSLKDKEIGPFRDLLSEYFQDELSLT